MPPAAVQTKVHKKQPLAALSTRHRLFPGAAPAVEPAPPPLFRALQRPSARWDTATVSYARFRPVRPCRRARPGACRGRGPKSGVFGQTGPAFRKAAFFCHLPLADEDQPAMNQQAGVVGPGIGGAGGERQHRRIRICKSFSHSGGKVGIRQ